MTTEGDVIVTVEVDDFDTRRGRAHQVRVATMENAGSGATPDLPVRALVVLGMTPRQLGRIVAKAA